MDVKVFTEDGALELAEKLLQNDKDIKDELEQKGYATESFVTEKIAEAQLEDKEVDLSGYALKSEIPSTLPASDVYDWAKAENKPTYTADEVGALPNTTEIPSIDGLVSEERLTEALSPYAKTADIVEYDDSELKSLIDDKAEKSTTIAGYGITDAYTKTEVDAVKSDVNAYTDGLNTAMNTRVVTLENLVGGGFSSIQTASISALFN